MKFLLSHILSSLNPSSIPKYFISISICKKKSNKFVVKYVRTCFMPFLTHNNAKYNPADTIKVLKGGNLYNSSMSVHCQRINSHLKIGLNGKLTSNAHRTHSLWVNSQMAGKEIRHGGSRIEIM